MVDVKPSLHNTPKGSLPSKRSGVVIVRAGQMVPKSLGPESVNYAKMVLRQWEI